MTTRSTRLTQPERAARRARLAAEVAAGKSKQEVASEYGVALSLVRTACEEAGVRRESHNTVWPSTFQVIAALANTDATLTDLAREFRVTKQRISQIYLRCLDAGIPVRVRSHGGAGAV